MISPHYASITQATTATEDYQSTIQLLSKHIQNAKDAQCNNDISTQQIEINNAEQTLLQYIDECKLDISDCRPLEEQIFSDVIDGLLLLPPSLLVDNSNDDGTTTEYISELQLSEQQKGFLWIEQA